MGESITAVGRKLRMKVKKECNVISGDAMLFPDLKNFVL